MNSISFGKLSSLKQKTLVHNSVGQLRLDTAQQVFDFSWALSVPSEAAVLVRVVLLFIWGDSRLGHGKDIMLQLISVVAAQVSQRGSCV